MYSTRLHTGSQCSSQKICEMWSVADQQKQAAPSCSVQIVSDMVQHTITEVPVRQTAGLRSSQRRPFTSERLDAVNKGFNRQLDRQRGRDHVITHCEATVDQHTEVSG